LRIPAPFVRSLITYAALLPVLTGAVTAQRSVAGQPSDGSTFVTGQVIDATSGAPIAGAVVEITGGPQHPLQLTDAQGRFLFQDVRPGQYLLTARAAGYVSPDASASDIMPRGRRLTARYEQPAGGIELRLSAMPVISGRVIDDLGEPVPGVRVSALLLSRPALTSPDNPLAGMPLVTGTTTDDRGEYSLSVTPGEYAVGALTTPFLASAVPAGAFRPPPGLASGTTIDALAALARTPAGSGPRGIPAQPPPATEPAARTWVWAGVFFPDSASPAQAERIALRAGNAREGVDLMVRLAAAATVSGTVMSPGGLPVPVQGLRLFPAGSGTDADVGFDVASTNTNSAGGFVVMREPLAAHLRLVQRIDRVLILVVP
jgi:hypothetical protein